MSKIFVSYAGRLGSDFARALRDFLELSNIECWTARANLEAGQWFEQIRGKVREMDRAIICVTRTSHRAEWIHFEAGALYNSSGDVKIAPYLFDVRAKYLRQPLSNFQAFEANCESTKRLFKAFDLPVERVDQHWPVFARRLARLRRRAWLRRWWILLALLVVAPVGAGRAWFAVTRSPFPAFEPALDEANTANATPLKVEHGTCVVGSDCLRGYRHSFETASSGGYATRVLNRWTPINLQNKSISLVARFRTGKPIIEVGLTDKGGNTIFFDCRATSTKANFVVPLDPVGLLKESCRTDVSSIQKFSIGYAAAAGAGEHAFDLLDLNLTPANGESAATPCRLRSCAQLTTTEADAAGRQLDELFGRGNWFIFPDQRNAIAVHRLVRGFRVTETIDSVDFGQARYRTGAIIDGGDQGATVNLRSPLRGDQVPPEQFEALVQWKLAYDHDPNRVFSATRLNGMFGAGKWRCHDLYDFAVIATHPQIKVGYPMTAVDHDDGLKYGVGLKDEVPAGSSTVWLAGKIPRAQCPATGA